MNKQKERLEWIDMAKGIGIYFVCIGHIEYLHDPLRIWISSYHMPLFFIISGILMAVKGEPEKDFKDCVYKKFRGILIPYFWFSLIYFLIDILNVAVFGYIDMHTFIVDQISSLTFYGFSVLWFLPAIFLADVFFLFLKKKLPDRVIYFLLIGAALAAYLVTGLVKDIYAAHEVSLLITSVCNFIFVFLRAIIAASLVGYGYYIHRLAKAKLPALFNITNFKTRVIVFLSGACLLIVNVILSQINGSIDMHNIILKNVPLFYIGAFLGTYAIILICMAAPVFKIITYFGRNSLIVMAAHVNFYILYAALTIALNALNYIKHAKYYMLILISSVVIFLLCAIVIEIINRFLPFIMGKKKQPGFRKIQ